MTRSSTTKTTIGIKNKNNCNAMKTTTTTITKSTLLQGPLQQKYLQQQGYQKQSYQSLYDIKPFLDNLCKSELTQKYDQEQRHKNYCVRSPSWLTNVCSRILLPVKFQGRFVMRRQVQANLKMKNSYCKERSVADFICARDVSKICNTCEVQLLRDREKKALK